MRAPGGHPDDATSPKGQLLDVSTIVINRFAFDESGAWLVQFADASITA
jgi:hypothetical protein